MNRIRIAFAAVLVSAVVSCTSFHSYQKAQEYEVANDWDKAVIEYSRALEIDPQNVKYKSALQRARLEASRAHFEKGKSLRAAGQNDLAAVELQLATRLDPTNQYAAVEYSKAVKAVQDLAHANEPKTLEQRKREAVTKVQPPELNPASDEPISLSFPRPTAVKDIYRALGNSFGINVVFDQAVKDDERISIELREVTAQQALERVMQAANHFYKVLDEKTIIVVPDTPQTRRDYEDLVIRTFYLSNGDAEQVTNVVRTMIEARNVFPLKALNAITIRDTADRVRIAEKIIEANDKAKAEVVIQVELLQVDAGKARDLGIQLTAGGSLARPTSTTGLLPIDQIGDLFNQPYSFTIPSVSYGLAKTQTEAQLLARPQLRISEGEKATLHIGRKQPIPVATLFNAGVGGVNSGPITSFQYQDIGIKISIEPRVHHNREVTLKLQVEVSNIASYEPSPNENTPRQPILGTRTIDSTIRLKDGETNFLAGLIRNDRSMTENDVPFLSELPIIGRLFSRDSTTNENTDVVLTMTPHIIRIPDITADDLAPLWVGTANNMTFRGVSPRLESANGVDPFNYPQQRLPGQAGETNPEWFGTGVNVPSLPIPAPSPEYVPPVPSGTGPTDIFQQPSPTPSPGVPPPPPPPGTTSEGSALNKGAASADLYQASLSPRIAPQPARLQIKPGEEKIWSVVGMDLSELSTAALVLHYDPTALDVIGTSIGVALSVRAEAPPLVKVDQQSGTIRILSSDGSPLAFQSGGDIVSFRVRGGMTGNTMMVIEPLELRGKNGQRVDVAIAGGRAEVQ